MNKAYDAARTFANATSEANRPKRLPPYETAHDACAQAIALDDQLALRRDLLRDACHLCSPHGTLRPPEGVRSARTRLLDMSAALDCAALTTTLQAMRQHLDDLLGPLKQAAVIAAERHFVVPHEA
jgi:hypothetical protein